MILDQRAQLKLSRLMLTLKQSIHDFDNDNDVMYWQYTTQPLLRRRRRRIQIKSIEFNYKSVVYLQLEMYNLLFN